ncbi:MAG: ACP S-malonyltransferase [Clostridia bacterium]|jgi:[acyl-carrier-protein] S-malonyltransferase
MGKLAFVFAGQGAQYVGMGKEIANQFKTSDSIFDEASDALGFDVKKMIFSGTDEQLMITENTQPTILTTSIACLQPLIESGLTPDAVAGLSLGEYSAHVLSGTMSFYAAVKLVRKRGKYMQEAVPIGIGGMAAIIGQDLCSVTDSCNEASKIGVVELANLNCPGQIVIAGELKALEKAMELCREKGAKRSILLPVSAPFHCSMLKPAGELLKKELEDVDLGELNIPVVTNVTAEYINDENLVKDLLVRQVSSSVLWEKSIRNMISDGIDTFIEIGPGKVLSGFIKKIDNTAITLNVSDIESLNNTLNHFV